MNFVYSVKATSHTCATACAFTNTLTWYSVRCVPVCASNYVTKPTSFAFLSARFTLCVRFSTLGLELFVIFVFLLHSFDFIIIYLFSFSQIFYVLAFKISQGTRGVY